VHATSEERLRSVEREDESPEWHAEIEMASPMVQAELSSNHGESETLADTKSPNTRDTVTRSRAETRMLRKLKRVKDGIHHQSRPGKVQDQVESILKIVEGPKGAEVLRSLVGAKDTGKEAATGRGRKAKEARDRKTTRTVVKRHALKGKTTDMRDRKKLVSPKVMAAEVDVEGEENVTKAEKRVPNPRAMGTVPGVTKEEQGTEAKKSRRERMQDLKAKGRSTKASGSVKVASTSRTKQKETDTTSPNHAKPKGKAAVEEPEEAPRPKQEPWGVQKSALERKFGETGWQPRKRLSPDTLEGIRALHVSNPTVYNIDMLREHFQISPEAIRRVLKSKWKPSAEEIEKRMKRWENRGLKKWSEMAAQGQKPPKKWREMGVPNPNLQKRVRWEGEAGEGSDGKEALHDKAAKMERGLRRLQAHPTPSLAGRIL
jgi:hypothetical protein